MEFHDISQALIGFIQRHQTWGPVIVGLLAFGESLAVFSLFIPATFVMMALGGLIGISGLELWPFCAGAALGAICGDTLSYEVGRRYGTKVREMWPLRNYPRIFTRGRIFFRRWGLMGVIIGRFIGPARAVVPLCAGMTKMQRPLFMLANICSAPLWAVVLLAPGAIGVQALF